MGVPYPDIGGNKGILDYLHSKNTISSLRIEEIGKIISHHSTASFQNMT